MSTCRCKRYWGCNRTRVWGLIKVKATRLLYFKASLFGITAFILIIAGLFFLNLKKPLPKIKESQSTTRFDVAEKKNVVQEEVKQQEVPQNQDLTPELDTVLEGFSFGIPSLELDMNAAQALLNGANSGVMSAQAVDVLPKVLNQPAVSYPPTAQEKGIQGLVEVSLLVSELGKVEKVNINRAEPKGVFEGVAKANVLQWKFEPAEYNGKKVSVWLNQTINFVLE